MKTDVGSKTMHLPWIVLHFVYGLRENFVWIYLLFDNINMFYFVDCSIYSYTRFPDKLDRNYILQWDIFY